MPFRVKCFPQTFLRKKCLLSSFFRGFRITHVYWELFEFIYQKPCQLHFFWGFWGVHDYGELVGKLTRWFCTFYRRSEYHTQCTKHTVQYTLHFYTELYTLYPTHYTLKCMLQTKHYPCNVHIFMYTLHSIL